MAKFAFTGDPNAHGSDPESIQVHGMTFPLGEAVEIEDEAIAAKLRTHSHFSEGEAAETVKPRRGRKPKAEEPAPEA